MDAEKVTDGLRAQERFLDSARVATTIAHAKTTEGCATAADTLIDASDQLPKLLWGPVGYSTAGLLRMSGAGFHRVSHGLDALANVLFQWEPWRRGSTPA